jgi:hypothetical protein
VLAVLTCDPQLFGPSLNSRDFGVE